MAGKAVGTIEAFMHSDDRKFDAEDKRLMGALGKVASLACQTLAPINFQIVEREKAEAALRELNETLEQPVQAKTRERLQIWNISMAATSPTAESGR
jgi:hypothetical protein